MAAKAHEIDRKPDDMIATRDQIATGQIFHHPPFRERIGQTPIAKLIESRIGGRCDARHIVHGHDGCSHIGADDMVNGISVCEFR
jgi:hypothetical protein